MSDPQAILPSRESALDPVAPRAERVLDAMQKVFSHDLPNQMVVVQSLISLMHEDETNLSPDDHEQLRRLRLAAGKASHMVHFLKDMARLARLSEAIESIRLSALTREIQAALHQFYPDREIRIEAAWASPMLVVGRRSFQQALLNLLRCGIDHFANKVLLVQLSSAEVESASEIRVRVQPGPGPLLTMPSSSGQDRTLPEQRMEFILARELLTLSGGTLAASPEPGCTFCFVIHVPIHVKHA